MFHLCSFCSLIQLLGIVIPQGILLHNSATYTLAQISLYVKFFFLLLFLFSCQQKGAFPHFSLLTAEASSCSIPAALLTRPSFRCLSMNVAFSICSKGCHYWQPFALRSATAQTEFLRLFFAVNHLNLSAQAAQLLIKALIATLNIDDVVYHRDTVRSQSSNDKRRSRS